MPEDPAGLGRGQAARREPGGDGMAQVMEPDALKADAPGDAGESVREGVNIEGSPVAPLVHEVEVGPAATEREPAPRLVRLVRPEALDGEGREWDLAPSAVRLRALERRREQVSAMVLAGVTYRQIAAELDVSLATIAGDVSELRDAWRERYTADYHEHASIELAKLEAVERRLWRLIAEGRLGAMQTWIKLSRRRAQLLGLDRPERIEAVVHDKPPAPDGRTITEVLTSAMAMAKIESTKVESNGGGSDGAER